MKLKPRNDIDKLWKQSFYLFGTCFAGWTRRGELDLFARFAPKSGSTDDPGFHRLGVLPLSEKKVDAEI